MSGTVARGWHVGEYEAVRWAETAVKAVAFVCAYVAFAHALGRSLHSPDSLHVFELALLGVAELGVLLTVGGRLVERELIALVFVVFNNAAHLGMLYSILAVPGPGVLLSVFCALMLGGELVKLYRLRATRPGLRELAPVAVQALVVGSTVIYLVALVAWQAFR